MQYILFVLACLSGQPGQCVGEPIALPEITNATGCHLASQIRLREWLQDHPDMRVKEAKCMARPITAAGAKSAS